MWNWWTERRAACVSTWNGGPLGTTAAWMTSAQSLMLLWMSSPSTLANRGKPSAGLSSPNGTSIGWAFHHGSFPDACSLEDPSGFLLQRGSSQTPIKVWESVLEARTETEENRRELEAHLPARCRCGSDSRGAFLQLLSVSCLYCQNGRAFPMSHSLLQCGGLRAGLRPKICHFPSGRCSLRCRQAELVQDLDPLEHSL